MIVALLLALGCSTPTEAPPTAPPVAKTAAAAAPKAEGPLLSGTISLADGVEAKGAALYLSVRPAGAAGGPPMAALKLPPDTFPQDFTLTMADVLPMYRRQPLPPAVDITVRLDADGDAMSRADGEPQAKLPKVTTGSTDLAITLQ